MPERPYGGLVKIAHFQGIDARQFVLILCSTPPHSSSSQPTPTKVRFCPPSWLDLARMSLRGLE